MRGRGSSSRPVTGYSLENHSADLIALLDSLGIEKTFVAGHSFGGLLGLYFAAHYPERVLGLTMIDAAVELHPMTPAFVLLLADRLGKWYPSREGYLTSLRLMPFTTYWDEDMERAFLADTFEQEEGSPLYVLTQKHHMAQCALAVASVPRRSWREWALKVPGPSLVVAARDPFIQGQHIVEMPKELETAVLMPRGAYEYARGNHVTMMFGPGAKDIAAHMIYQFLA
jgi:pimeloyl-ACP methyl ester carboxylesterase